MDHRYIEENNITDSYALGKLSAAERARFEEHFIDCQECLDRLEFAEVFCQAVNQVMVEKAVSTTVTFRSGFYGHLAQLSPRWQSTVFASLILLFATLLVILATQFVDNRRLNRELALANAASLSQSARSSVSAGRESSNTGAGKEVSPMTEPSPTASPQRPARVEPIETLRRLANPQINTPIFTLNAVRNASPVNEIEIANSPQWLIFSIELEAKPKYQTYHATIFTADGRRLWSASGLQPNRYDAFILSFPSTFFQSNDYSIVLEGKMPDGQLIPAANSSFRITKKNP